MSICSFFSPSSRCHLTLVREVSHRYSGNMMNRMRASGHQYHALIASTAIAVMIIEMKAFEAIFANVPISAIERFRRETIVPVSSSSYQRCGRLSSLS